MKRLLSLILCLTMVISCLPVSALAEDDDPAVEAAAFVEQLEKEEKRSVEEPAAKTEKEPEPETPAKEEQPAKEAEPEADPAPEAQLPTEQPETEKQAENGQRFEEQEQSAEERGPAPEADGEPEEGPASEEEPACEEPETEADEVLSKEELFEDGLLPELTAASSPAQTISCSVDTIEVPYLDTVDLSRFFSVSGSEGGATGTLSYSFGSSDAGSYFALNGSSLKTIEVLDEIRYLKVTAAETETYSEAVLDMVKIKTVKKQLSTGMIVPSDGCVHYSDAYLGAFDYDGEWHSPIAKLTHGGEDLKRYTDFDYDVSDVNKKDVDTYAFKIEGKGDHYDGSLDVTWKILQAEYKLYYNQRGDSAYGDVCPAPETVSFDGEPVPEGDSVIVTPGTFVTLPASVTTTQMTQTPGGWPCTWRFDGWYGTGEMSGEKITSVFVPSGDKRVLDVYGKWICTPVEVTRVDLTGACRPYACEKFKDEDDSVVTKTVPESTAKVQRVFAFGIPSSWNTAAFYRDVSSGNLEKVIGWIENEGVTELAPGTAFEEGKSYLFMYALNGLPAKKCVFIVNGETVAGCATGDTGFSVFRVYKNVGWNPNDILTPENFPDGGLLEKLREKYPAGLTAEGAAAVTSLDLEYTNIEDPTGIDRFFTGLEDLRLYCCDIKKIDLSRLTKLRKLNLAYNELTTLDLSANVMLESADLSYNGLTALDLMHNVGLKTLNVKGNELSWLDTSANTGLTALSAEGQHPYWNEVPVYPVGDRYLIDFASATGADDLSAYEIRFTGDDPLTLLTADEPNGILSAVQYPNLDYEVDLGAGKLGVEVPYSVDLREEPLFIPEQDHVVVGCQTSRKLGMKSPVRGLGSNGNLSVTWRFETVDGYSTDLIEVLDDGSLYVKLEGTYRAFCSAAFYGEPIGNEFCVRVDVTAGESPMNDVMGAVLANKQATLELYSRSYPELTVLLRLGDLEQRALTAAAPVPRDRKEMDLPQNDYGVTIGSARFANEQVAALFDLRVVSDRKLMVVPKAETIEKAAKNAKSVGSKYVSGIFVTLTDGAGETAEMDAGTLTLTVKKTLPKLKTAPVKLDSGNYSCSGKPLSFGFEVITVETNPAYDYVDAKGTPHTALPSWIKLGDDSGYYIDYQGPVGAKLSGTAYLLVTPAGFNVKVPVSVKVSAAPVIPQLKVLTPSLSLNAAVKDHAELKLRVATAGYEEKIADFKYEWYNIEVTEGSGKSLKTYCFTDLFEGNVEYDPENGTAELAFTVRSDGSNPIRDGKAHTLKLTVPFCGKTYTATLKVITAASLSGKVNGQINIAVPGSPVDVALKTTGFNWNEAGDSETAVEPVFFDPAGNELASAPFRVDKTGIGAYRVTALSGLTEPGTYSVRFTVKLSDTVTVEKSFPVKVIGKPVEPALTLKAEGAIDPLRRTGDDAPALRLVPTVKNCYDYDLGRRRDKVFYKDGKNWLPVPVGEDPFNVLYGDGAFLVRADRGVRLEPGRQYGIEITLYNPEGDVATSKIVPVPIKKGKVPAALTTAASGELLLLDRYDGVDFGLEFPDGMLNGAPRIGLDAASAQLFELSTKTAYPDGGFPTATVTLGWKDHLLPAAKLLPKAGSAKTVKLNVFADGNDTEKPDAVLSVKITFR